MTRKKQRLNTQGVPHDIDCTERTALCGTHCLFQQIRADISPGAQTSEVCPAAAQVRLGQVMFDPVHQSREVMGIEIVTATGVFPHRGHTLPTKFTARILCSDGELTTHHFIVLSAGFHRVAYTTQEMPWVIKMQVLEGMRNHNQEEWDQFCSMPALRSVVPQTHGYAQAPIGDTDVSLLVMDRVGFTFADLVKMMSRYEPSTTSMFMVAVATKEVVWTIVRSTRGGLRAYQWHIENVAFKHDGSLSVKLMNWADNRVVTTHDSLRVRIHTALVQFSGGLHPGNYAGKNTNVPLVWNGFMNLMHQALNEWISHWALIRLEQEGDALPSDEEMNHLETILLEVVQYTLSLNEVASQTTESFEESALTTLARPAYGVYAQTADSKAT